MTLSGWHDRGTMASFKSAATLKFKVWIITIHYQVRIYCVRAKLYFGFAVILKIYRNTYNFYSSWPLPDSYTCDWMFFSLKSYRNTHLSRVLYIYLVRDCFPVPPTPTSRALPRSCLIIRAIRETCSTASMKNTSFISLADCMLKSSKYCKTKETSCLIIRAIRDTCSTAFKKNTSFISLADCMLKSSKYCKTKEISCLIIRAIRDTC